MKHLRKFENFYLPPDIEEEYEDENVEEDEEKEIDVTDNPEKLTPKEEDN